MLTKFFYCFVFQKILFQGDGIEFNFKLKKSLNHLHAIIVHSK